ncbi:MAG: amidohydrolase [Actinomycetes bacterium]
MTPPRPAADAAVDTSVFSSPLALAVRTRVDEVAPELVALSHAIAADPELAYEEVRASAACADLLERHGLQVERGAYGLPTAFAARAGSHGPHVVVCAEYDALPGVGHACGHNIIAASGAGAGIALAGVAEEAGLRVTVLGTPAEESGGGKVDMIRAGALEGVDFAMMVHPSPFDVHDSRGLAIEEWEVVYRGQASHASYAPQLGRNALDGLVAGYSAIAMLRQHLAPLQQVHGVITDGGAAANVVPERAAATYYLRALDLPGLEDLRHRVHACLEGGATATGTTVEVRTVGNTYDPVDPHPGLVATFGAACAEIGRAYTPNPAGEELGGSTDFGNVSQLVPAVHADLAVHSWPAVNHQHEFAAHCVTAVGDRTMLEGATALALTAVAVAADPSIIGLSAG